MKNKIITILVSGVFISVPAFSQDTIHISPQAQKDTSIISQPNSNYNEKIISRGNQNKVEDEPVEKPMYRDTRLGSSSPLYDTYEKNDYGVGAITTNPNK